MAAVTQSDLTVGVVSSLTAALDSSNPHINPISSTTTPHTSVDYTNSLQNYITNPSIYGVTIIVLPSQLTPLPPQNNIVLTNNNYLTNTTYGASQVYAPTQLSIPDLAITNLTDDLYNTYTNGIYQYGTRAVYAPTELKPLSSSYIIGPTIEEAFYPYGTVQVYAPKAIAPPLTDNKYLFISIDGKVIDPYPYGIVQVYAPTPVKSPTGKLSISTSEIPKASDSFIIRYKNSEGIEGAFVMALLPAIETNLQYSPSGSMKGQTGVPEVKPGIPSMTTMKYKNILVPGGTPILQTIGVQGVTHTLIGAFIGSEGKGNSYLPEELIFSTKGSLDPIYNLNSSYTNPLPNSSSLISNTVNAYQSAKFFDKTVVRSGYPIIATVISGGITYTYEGVVLDFKFYAVRDNRAYYVIDILTSNYREY